MVQLLKSYRIFKDIHLQTANTGYGASVYPGRWNHRNVPLLYSSGSLALSCLEIVVNANVPGILDDYLFIEYQFKSTIVEVLDIRSLPAGWMDSPPSNITRDIGSEWIKMDNSAILRVPSAIISQEYNYLINPNHHDFSSVIISKADKFIFDNRLRMGK